METNRARMGPPPAEGPGSRERGVAPGAPDRRPGRV